MADEPKPPETPLPPINEPPKEIEVKLATGQVYKGKTTDEVMQQLVRAQEEASRTISELRRHPEPQPQPPAPAGEFDINHYYKLLAETPLEADNYMWAHKLGIEPDQVVPTLRYIYDTAQRAGASMEISNFHARHPEFPGGQDVADLMFQELENRGKNPMSATTEDFENVYYSLRDAKKITPLENPQATQAPTYAPTLSGGNNGAPDVVSDFNNLTSAQMEAYFKKIGAM